MAATGRALSVNCLSWSFKDAQELATQKSYSHDSLCKGSQVCECMIYSRFQRETESVMRKGFVLSDEC